MSLMLHRTGLLRPTLGAPANAVPDAFDIEDWSIAPGDEKADVTINSLPDDVGATITDIEYRIDGGSWISSAGTSSFTISGLTNDQAYDVELRAVNSVGAGAPSDTKSVTPEAEDEEWHPNDLASPPLAVWDPAASGSLWQDAAATTPAGDGDPLGRIDDQSVNGNDAVQSTDTKRPLFDTIDGKPWIVCDGVDDGMVFTNVKPAMVAAVVYFPSSGPANNRYSAFGRAELDDTNNVRTRTDGLWGANVSGLTDANDFVYSDGVTRFNGVAATTIGLITFPKDAPFIVTTEAGSAGSQSSEGLATIGLPSVAGRAWPGRFGRMVLLSALPDAGEYDNLLAWLAEPYGISL